MMLYYLKHYNNFEDEETFGHAGERTFDFRKSTSFKKWWGFNPLNSALSINPYINNISCIKIWTAEAWKMLWVRQVLLFYSVSLFISELKGIFVPQNILTSNSALKHWLIQGNKTFYTNNDHFKHEGSFCPDWIQILLF